MAFFQSLIHTFKNSFNFRDRASRKEFWYFMIFYLVLYTPINIYESFRFALNNFDLEFSTWDVFISSPLTLILTFIFMVPLWSLTARRLHDVGKSGWWQLIYITVIGMLPLLYWFSQRGNPSANKYGLPSLLR